MVPLVSVWVWQEPGNYTHLILSPRNYPLITKSGTSTNFEVRYIAFHVLVVSIVSTYVCTSSTLDFFLQFLLFIFPFATSDKMNNCHYYVYISHLINFKIQYQNMCLTSDPLSITFDILFCYKITSGPVRMFKTLKLQISCSDN